MAEYKKLVKYTTPKVLTKWVHLNKPQTEYKAEGVYSVTVLMPESDQATQDLVAFLTKAHEEAVNSYRTELLSNPKTKAKAKSIKVIDLPVKKDVDANGDETGFLAISFKMNASGTDKKTGKPWTKRPTIFDAKGVNVTSTIPPIYGGSTVRVSYEVAPYGGDIGVGIKLRLVAVQVIDLKTGGAMDAKGYGFGEEDGFDSSSIPASEEPEAVAVSEVESGSDF